MLLFGCFVGFQFVLMYFIIIPQMPVCVFSNGDRQGADLDGKGVGRNREE